MDELSDIEDFYQDPLDPNNRHSSKQVAPKSFQRSSTSATLVDSQSTKLVPGTAKIFLKTWGCSHNNSDSEYMAGLLAEQGHQIIFETSMANTADVWVLNSCTVKGPSQQTFQNEISAGVAAGKKVVVAGCVPQASPHENAFTNCSVVGVQQIDKICYAVEQTLAGNTVRFLKETKRFNDKGKKVKSGGAALSLPKIRRNPYIEIIAVNTGCLNQCTYCKTKHARGDLGSYSVAEIVDRVATVLGEGVLEIWLTSGYFS